MIRLVITLAMVFAFGRDAFADNPRIKELVTVTGELIRIGDLVDDAGANANVAVFRAPDLGQTGSVKVNRVTDALRPHGLTGLDTGGISEIVVTRLSRTIESKDIEERIARAVAGQYGFGDANSLQVTLDRQVRTLHIEASATAELAITRINVEARTGRFDVMFEVPGSAVARRLPLRFTGAVTETTETATLTRSLTRGDVVRAGDVTIERKPKAEIGGDDLTLEQVVGLATRRPLRAGQALRLTDLMKPEVVQRNETVTIFYEVPGIMLTARGKASETGAVGDTINVLNIQSNRSVQATITGPGRVAITATLPRVAASAATENTARRSAE